MEKMNTQNRVCTYADTMNEDIANSSATPEDPKASPVTLLHQRIASSWFLMSSDTLSPCYIFGTVCKLNIECEIKFCKQPVSFQ